MTDYAWLAILAGFNITNFWKKTEKLSLTLSYVLGRQWFINKHRITFSEFKVTNKPWYKFAAGQRMSVQLTNERSLLFKEETWQYLEN